MEWRECGDKTKFVSVDDSIWRRSLSVNCSWPACREEVEERSGAKVDCGLAWRVEARMRPRRHLMAWLVALCEWCAGGRQACTVDRFTAGCGQRPGLHLWIPRYPASQSRSQLVLRKAQPEQPDDAKENQFFSVMHQ